LPSNDKPPEHYALCVYSVNYKKYAGKAIIPNSTGAAKAVGLVFQDALLFSARRTRRGRPAARASLARRRRKPPPCLTAMFDRHAPTLLRPALNAAARGLVRAGISADALTWLGFAIGMAAAVAIALHAWWWGLALLLASRLLDGLDGSVARLTQPTDAGGFLDIALDFLFYAAIPLAFAVANPATNALPAAALLASFIGTGSSFLAFAALAEKRGLTDTALPGKSFYFLGGLTEATETITVFAAMCVWPEHFAVLAYGFAGLCAITTGMRVGWGYWRLG
jgi:phosphatidylglycerophosphate synthase